MTERPDLFLSGLSYTTPELPDAGCEPGDLKLYLQDDSKGRWRRSHGHTNEGYSGKVNASIWGGTAWRRFDVWALLGREAVTFPARQEAEAAITRVRHGVTSKAGTRATWDGKRYVPQEERDTKGPEVDQGS